MSSGFISENEIEERRRIRQVEWEKVRKPDEPKEAPEEDYDHRTLFERLEEQRQKKEMEYEETHKLKNMIKGLDDDEIEFLDMVDRTKMEQEKRLKMEEAKELREFRNKVAALRERQSKSNDLDDEESVEFSSLDQPFSTKKVPKNKALANILKKRPSSDSTSPFPAKKIATEKSASTNGSSKPSISSGNVNSNSELDESSDNSKLSRFGAMKETMVLPSAMKCVGVLPGIGSYISDDSSESDNTSGSDVEDSAYDLRGQKMKKEVKSS